MKEIDARIKRFWRQWNAKNRRKAMNNFYRFELSSVEEDDSFEIPVEDIDWEVEDYHPHYDRWKKLRGVGDI